MSERVFQLLRGAAVARRVRNLVLALFDPRSLGRLRSQKSGKADLGAIAQLGERYNGIVEVSGSIPLSSTISSLKIPWRKNDIIHHSEVW